MKTLFARATHGRWLPLPLLGALLVLALAGCSGPGNSSLLAAASVNGHAIALDDFNQLSAYERIESAEQTSQPDANPCPVATWQSPEGRSALGPADTTALDQLVNLELMRQLVAANHVTVSQSDLNAVRKTLDQNIATARVSAASNACLRALLNKLTPRVETIFVQEQAYETALVQSLHVQTVHLRVIQATDQNSALQIKQQLDNGANFDDVAKQQAQSATPNSDFGTAYYAQLPQSVNDPIFAATERYIIVSLPSTVQGQSVTEWYVLEITDPKQQTFAEVGDTSTAVSNFVAWLGDYADRHSHIQRFVVLPPPPTQN